MLQDVEEVRRDLFFSRLFWNILLIICGRGFNKGRRLGNPNLQVYALLLWPPAVSYLTFKCPGDLICPAV